MIGDKQFDVVHPATIPIDQLENGCSFHRTRRSGPGGQHRNKVESAIVVTHVASGIKAEANERRSQHENRREAIKRLRVRLAIELRTPVNKNDGPSEKWKSRVTSGKIVVSQEHEDFAAMLAEALNMVEDQQFDVAKSAELLGVSTSQLVKLFKNQPEAMSWLNSNRLQKNLTILK